MPKTRIDAIGKEVELLNCPFCGESATLWHTTDNHHSPYVQCDGAIQVNHSKSCFACQYPWRFKTDEEAIAAWNRRTSNEPQTSHQRVSKN